MGNLSQTFALPVGTVTFLLSDVEGSTKLWEKEPTGMERAMPRLYQLLDVAVNEHGGVRPIEQGEGDSIVAAFSRASDALAAALSAQLAIAAESWPSGLELRVRIALHAGDAQLRDEGNYFGLTISRCARLRAIASGGQTVMSRAVRDLVTDRMPDGVGLVDCGVHRLRDLGRPEHVFLLEHPSLPGGHRSLRSLDSLPNNLPTQLSTFVGRERELEEVRHALAETRLLTLTGPGGSGKTRLALQAAADALERFADGVWLVDLSQVNDPQLVGEAVASAIGVRTSIGMSAIEVSCAHLAGRHALLVLDNCEHVLDEAAAVATALLSTCAEVTMLATSRAPLAVPAETDWRVPTLSLPPRELGIEPLDALSQSDAVRLFLERARKVRPNFALDETSAPAVAQICHELDGIPLAIELAAARVRMLTVGQISAGLVDRFHLLTGGARTALPRQQTLRASVDWSHEHLLDSERTLFRRLGVFVGGFSLDAAEHVGAEGDVESYAVLDLLTSLVDKSLVLAEEHGPLVRYRLLETVRQYALDRAGEADERDAVFGRHLDWFLALAERAAPELETNRQQQWLAVLDADAANFVAALERASGGDAERVLRLAAALTFWWRDRGRFAEAEAGYSHALAVGAAGPAALRARVHWGRAFLAAHAGDYELAREHGESALALADAEGDASTAARTLAATGVSELFADGPLARPRLERALVLARAASDRWAEVEAAQLLAFSYWFQNDNRKSAELLDPIEERVAREAPAIQVSRQALDRGILAFFAGHMSEARRHFERGSRSVVEEPVMAGFNESELGLMDALEGRPEQALERIEASLEHALARGAGLVVPVLQVQGAYAERALGQLTEAYARVSTWLPLMDGNSTYLYSWGCALRADVARRLGDTTTAIAAADAGIAAAERLDNAYLVGENRLVLGRIAASNGDWGTAEQHAYVLLDACAESDGWVFLPDALDVLSEAAAGAGRHADAVRMLGAADRARRDFGTCRWTGEDSHWLTLCADLRDSLGAAFDTLWASGEALSLTEATAWVRRARGERRRPPTGWESLTPTELRVVELAVAGLTNPQVAERMFISRATVKTHLEHVYAKLGVPNRASLATAYAARQEVPT